MDYVKLLNQKNFLNFLKSIISTETNSTIVTSAKQISFAIQGNNNIASNPYYTELYKKYKFQLKVVRNNSGNAVELYSWIGDNIRYIGGIYKGQNPYTVNVVTYPPSPKPTPTPTPPVVILDYITDDINNYIVSDTGEYLFVTNQFNVNPPDPI